MRIYSYNSKCDTNLLVSADQEPNYQTILKGDKTMKLNKDEAVARIREYFEENEDEGE